MKNLPSELLAKISQFRQTPINDADPKMAITVTRAKDTVMDSTYWTTEIIRTKEGLGDLSVAPRRLKPYGSPDSIYNIYVDNGVIKTALRAYPDYHKNGWVDQFEIGPGSAVAISFDGYWQIYKAKWQMTTSEKPWIFWVTNGTLYTQLWDIEASRVELATDVVKVKAVRGWKNVNMPEIDQGIIAGYIKTDGGVYYRNYAWQDLTSQFAWEFEREITEFNGIAVNLNLFLTNDYRMGFIIEDDNNDISWYITTRAWAGMAIAPDVFGLKLKANIDFIPIKFIESHPIEKFDLIIDASILFLYADEYNRFNSIENIEDDDENWGIFIEFTTEYELFTLSKDDFELVDENNVKFRGQEITKISSFKYRIKLEDFNNAIGECSFVCKGLYITNAAGYLFDSFNIIFEPIELVPDETGPPEVEVIWNE